MRQKKLATFALLAHINNNNSELKDLSSVFEPLIKRSLALYFSNGVTSGQVTDIKEVLLSEYDLDMPISFLVRKIKEFSLNDNGEYGLRISGKAIFCNKFEYDNYIEEINVNEKKVDNLEVEVSLHILLIHL